MKKWIIYLSIITASGLCMVTLYNSMVDAKSWGANIPSSIQAARNYYLHVDPRNFFQFIAPINQTLITLAIIFFWKVDKVIRYYFISAFLLYAIIFLLTIFYFIPRDVIIFSTTNNNHSMQEVSIVLAQWKVMNWLRSIIGIAGVIFTCLSLDRYYKLKKQ